MATFRAITAEEEAAAAIFRSLKRRRYDNASLLNDLSHVHKHAAIPFIGALSHFFEHIDDSPEMQLWINPKAEKPKLLIRYLGEHPETGKPAWIAPRPPLHFSQLRRNETNTQEDHFAVGVKAFLASMAADDLLSFVRDRVKRRNMLLYSSEQGYFDVKIDFDGMFAEYRDNVFLLLRALLMIDPWKERQMFVQEALNAFLAHLKAFPREIRETA